MSAPLATIKLGLHLVSEANKHEHYRARSTRAKTHRTTAWAKILAEKSLAKWTLPLVVTIVRIAPRELDSDNLSGCAKHARDGIADARVEVRRRVEA